MGTTKKTIYSENTLELATIAKAIGHPARVTILQYLFEHTIGSNKFFQSLTGLSKATVSQHLAELLQAHLIETDFINNESIFYLHQHSKNRIELLTKEILR
jgi:ArsR family transcriptional regulator, arsenate/arsenite/antimonite-responsive transcriptional repressor